MWSVRSVTHPCKQDNRTFTAETNTTLDSRRKARLCQVLQCKLAQKLTDQVTSRQDKPDRTSSTHSVFTLLPLTSISHLEMAIPA